MGFDALLKISKTHCFVASPFWLWRNIVVNKFSNKKTSPHTHIPDYHIENNIENWVNTILDHWSVNKLYHTRVDKTTRRQMYWCTCTHTHFTLNSEIVIMYWGKYRKRRGRRWWKSHFAYSKYKRKHTQTHIRIHILEKQKEITSEKIQQIFTLDCAWNEQVFGEN